MNIKKAAKPAYMVIDQGNTRIKLTMLNAGMNVISSEAGESPDFADVVMERMLEWPDIPAIYCSVGHIDARFVETLRMMRPDGLFVFTHKTPLPFEVEYDPAAGIGLDRVAGIAGALHLYPGEVTLVADAGTALTLDIANAPENCFDGGTISPGLSMRFVALSSMTSTLPLVNPNGPCPVFGKSTDTCIRSGILGGMVAEITTAFARVQLEYGEARLVITGGDADVIFELLDKELINISKAAVVPNLLAVGMTKIYLYNENI